MTRNALQTRLFTVIAVGIGVMAAFSSPCAASVIYVDINDVILPAAPVGATWNSIDANNSSADLKDTTGSSTGIGLALSGFSSSLNSGGGDWAGTPVVWAVDGATSDGAVVAADTTAQLTFTGLTVSASTTYNLEVISSRASASSPREATFTLDGSDPDNFSGAFSAVFDGWTNRTVLTWDDLSPASSTVVLNISVASGSSGFINALSLTETVVPEPASLMFLGIGSLMMFPSRGQN